MKAFSRCNFQIQKEYSTTDNPGVGDSEECFRHFE